MFPHPIARRLRPRREFLLADDGMTTVEYCLGLLAAAALAVVLYAVVTSDDVLNGITSIVQRAFKVQS